MKTAKRTEPSFAPADRFTAGRGGRAARFAAHLGDKGLVLTRDRGRTRLDAGRIEISYPLLAGLLRHLAAAAKKGPPRDRTQRRALGEAAQALAATLAVTDEVQGQESESMSAEEEVALLHILE